MGGGHGHDSYRPSGHHYFKGARRASLRPRRATAAAAPPLAAPPCARAHHSACTANRRGVEPVRRLVVRPQGLAAEHGVCRRVRSGAAMQQQSQPLFSSCLRAPAPAQRKRHSNVPMYAGTGTRLLRSLACNASAGGRWSPTCGLHRRSCRRRRLAQNAPQAVHGGQLPDLLVLFAKRGARHGLGRGARAPRAGAGSAGWRPPSGLLPSAVAARGDAGPRGLGRPTRPRAHPVASGAAPHPCNSTPCPPLQTHLLTRLPRPPPHCRSATSPPSSGCQACCTSRSTPIRRQSHPRRAVRRQHLAPRARACGTRGVSGGGGGAPAGAASADARSPAPG